MISLRDSKEEIGNMEYGNNLQPIKKLNDGWNYQGKHWNIPEGRGVPTGRFMDPNMLKEKGLLDEHDMLYLAWLENGKPKASMSKFGKKYIYDDWQNDFKHDKIKFDKESDGNLLFDADESLSPQELVDALKNYVSKTKYFTEGW